MILPEFEPIFCFHLYERDKTAPFKINFSVIKVTDCSRFINEFGFEMKKFVWQKEKKLRRR